jgi:hypothetical protein
VSHYPNYSGVAACSLVAVMHQKVGIIALNSMTKLGHFEQLHEVILSAYCSLVILSLEVHGLKQSVATGKSTNESLGAAVKSCETAVQAEEPFTAMMASICERSGMQHYCILRYITLGQFYELLLTNQPEPGTTIPEADKVIQKIKETDQIFALASSGFSESALPHVLADAEHLVVAPVTKTALVLVLGGSEPSLDPVFLHSLLPILSILIKSHLIRFKPACLLVDEINKVNFSNSLVNVDQMASADFLVASLSDTQRIEAVLHIFVRSRFLDVLHTDLVHLTEFIKVVEKGYTALPYHNWEHAVNVTQFLYTIFVKSQLSTIFPEIEIVALFLAALCHDVDHKGISSWTLVKCNEASSFISGIQSTLERHQCHVATKILTASSLKTAFTDKTFWSLFINSIIGTDLSRLLEFLADFKAVAGSFDKADLQHRIKLGQLVVMLANLSNCFRGMEFHLKMVRALEEERAAELEYLQKNCEVEQTPSQQSMAARELTFLDGSIVPLVAVLEPFLGDMKLANQIPAIKQRWESEFTIPT